MKRPPSSVADRRKVRLRCYYTSRAGELLAVESAALFHPRMADRILARLFRASDDAHRPQWWREPPDEGLPLLDGARLLEGSVAVVAKQTSKTPRKIPRSA